MKKIGFIIGVLASVLAIATYFGISATPVPADNPGSNATGIDGNNNKNNTIVQNANNVNIRTNGDKDAAPDKCTKELTYIAKAGHYGAINVDTYNQLKSSLEKQKSGSIEKLLLDKQIYQFSPGEVVCLEDTAFYSYRKKVFAPSQRLSYWVNNNAIVKAD
jgi:hypothetical protein